MLQSSFGSSLSFEGEIQAICDIYERLSPQGQTSRRTPIAQMSYKTNWGTLMGHVSKMMIGGGEGDGQAYLVPALCHKGS